MITKDKPVLAYTVNELAASSGWSRSQLYEEIKNGRLVAKKKGNKGFIVLVADAETWLKSLDDV